MLITNCYFDPIFKFVTKSKKLYQNIILAIIVDFKAKITPHYGIDVCLNNSIGISGCMGKPACVKVLVSLAVWEPAFVMVLVSQAVWEPACVVVLVSLAVWEPACVMV